MGVSGQQLAILDAWTVLNAINNPRECQGIVIQSKLNTTQQRWERTSLGRGRPAELATALERGAHVQQDGRPPLLTA